MQFQVIHRDLSKCYYQCLNKSSYIFAEIEPTTTKNNNIPKIIPLTLIMIFRKEISIDRNNIIGNKIIFIIPLINPLLFY